MSAASTTTHRSPGFTRSRARRPLIATARHLALAAAVVLPVPGLVGQAVDTYFHRNTPTECQQKMRSYAAAGHKMICVAYQPGGSNRWSVITDQTFFNRNIPQECHDKMVAYSSAGHQILSVAYPPAGGNSWSIITDKTFYNRNVPQECHDKMVAYSSAGQKLRWVAFPPAGGNQWSLVTDRSFFNRGALSECHRVMRAMFQCPGGPLRQVAFDPDGDGFTIVSDMSPLGIPATITSGNEVFSLDKFADEIKQQMVGKGLKYGFVIRYGSAIRSYASGPKRTANPSTGSPQQDFTIYDRFNPASVTKVITATAVLRAVQNLQNAGSAITLNDSIAGYLPTHWNVPASVQTITIRELLAHTSGFRTSGEKFTYDQLQTMVEAGITLSNKTFKYRNANSALARIVCAYLDGYAEVSPSSEPILGPAATSDRFIRFVQKYLMDPCGAPSVLWKPDAVEPTLFYPTPPATSAGTDYGDWTLTGGAAGVNISLAELAIFLDRLANSSSILSSSMRAQMEAGSLLLGWDPSHRTAKNSTRIQKGGLFTPGWGGELRSWVAKYSNGVQVAAVVNGNLSIPLWGSYDNAWSPIQMSIQQSSPGMENVTARSISVTGNNLQLTTQALFGPHVITSTNAGDPTQPYFRVISSTQLEVHPPQGLAPGRYPLSLSTGLATSNSVIVTLTRAARPTTLVSPAVSAGQSYTAVVSSGNLGTLPMWPAISTSNAPSNLPGIISMGIGSAFRSVVFWPTALMPDPTTGAVQLRLPSGPAMAGGTVHFQTIYGTRSFPLPVSNVASASFR